MGKKFNLRISLIFLGISLIMIYTIIQNIQINDNVDIISDSVFPIILLIMSGEYYLVYKSKKEEEELIKAYSSLTGSLTLLIYAIHKYFNNSHSPYLFWLSIIFTIYSLLYLKIIIKRKNKV